MTSPPTAHSAHTAHTGPRADTVATTDPAATPCLQTSVNAPPAHRPGVGRAETACAAALAGPPDVAEDTLPQAASADEQGASVLHLVDFKWLMAGEGHRIDLSRLQQDRAYARGCIALANASTCSALRDAGHRMSRLLRVVAPRV